MKQLHVNYFLSSTNIQLSKDNVHANVRLLLFYIVFSRNILYYLDSKIERRNTDMNTIKFIFRGVSLIKLPTLRLTTRDEIYKPTSPTADYENIKSDWYRVGNDIIKVMN